MRCVIEGWPDDGEIAPGLQAALVGLVARQTEGFEPAVSVVEAPGVFRVESDATSWPELAKLVVLAMRLCGTRAMWLWHITDDEGAIEAELETAGLCAWRGMFCRLAGAASEWRPEHVTRSEAVDEAIREKLAVVARETMTTMGVRVPVVEAVAPVTAALQLFEFIPDGDWMSGGESSVVGRSMVQVDGRQPIHRIKGRIEIGNPGRRVLDAVRVQVTLRGPDGALLGAVCGEALGLPVGSVRVVSVEGELPLGRLAVKRIDIGCQAIQQATAAFAARVLEA